MTDLKTSFPKPCTYFLINKTEVSITKDLSPCMSHTAYILRASELQQYLATWIFRETMAAFSSIGLNSYRMAFGIQVFLCSGEDLWVCSQEQPTLLWFVGSTLCTGRQDKNITLKIWQPEWAIISVYSSHPKKPCWGKQVPVLPACLCLFSRRDSSETCVRHNAWKSNTGNAFPAFLLGPASAAGEARGKASSCAATLLPPVFTSFGSPLVSVCWTIRRQGVLKILQRGN